MTSINIANGAALKTVMKDNEINGKTLAQKLGVTVQSVSGWIQDKQDVPQYVKTFFEQLEEIKKVKRSEEKQAELAERRFKDANPLTAFDYHQRCNELALNTVQEAIDEVLSSNNMDYTECTVDAIQEEISDNNRIGEAVEGTDLAVYTVYYLHILNHSDNADHAAENGFLEGLDDFSKMIQFSAIYAFEQDVNELIDQDFIEQRLNEHSTITKFKDGSQIESKLNEDLDYQLNIIKFNGDVYSDINDIKAFITEFDNSISEELKSYIHTNFISTNDIEININNQNGTFKICYSDYSDHVE